MTDVQTTNFGLLFGDRLAKKLTSWLLSDVRLPSVGGDTTRGDSARQKKSWSDLASHPHALSNVQLVTSTKLEVAREQTFAESLGMDHVLKKKC